MRKIVVLFITILFLFSISGCKKADVNKNEKNVQNSETSYVEDDNELEFFNNYDED